MTVSTAPQKKTTSTIHDGEAKKLSLSTLADFSWEELNDMFRNAPEPVALRHLSGHPRCRVVSAPLLSRAKWRSRSLPLAAQRWTNSNKFPWEGKSFFPSQTSAAEVGTGYNRMRLHGIITTFEFETRITPSLLDGRDCIAIEYDRSSLNPKWYQPIVDEIREVAPNVFLGMALYGREARMQFAVFAVDFNDLQENTKWGSPVPQ